MVTEALKRAQKKYAKKLYDKGIKQHIFRCNEQQYIILKTFFELIKKIENLDTLTGLDVSDDFTEFKLLFDDNIENKG